MRPLWLTSFFNQEYSFLQEKKLVINAYSFLAHVLLYLWSTCYSRGSRMDEVWFPINLFPSTPKLFLVPLWEITSLAVWQL